MSLQTLLEILRESELDQPTKIGIIDLVSRAQNDDVVNDIIDLLVQWNETDNKEEAEFKKAVKKIEDEYEGEVTEIMEKADHELDDAHEILVEEGVVQELKKQIKE